MSRWNCAEVGAVAGSDTACETSGEERESVTAAVHSWPWYGYVLGPDVLCGHEPRIVEFASTFENLVRAQWGALLVSWRKRGRTHSERASKKFSSPRRGLSRRSKCHGVAGSNEFQATRFVIISPS